MSFGDWRDKIIAEHPGKCPHCGARVVQVLLPDGSFSPEFPGKRAWYVVEESSKGLIVHECRPKAAA